MTRFALLAQEGSSIHDAACKGDVAMLQECVAAGEDINSRGEGGCTALQFAADRGHLEAVQWLIQHGADLNAQDEEGQTALHYAAMCEQHEVSWLGWCCTAAASKALWSCRCCSARHLVHSAVSVMWPSVMHSAPAADEQLCCTASDWCTPAWLPGQVSISCTCTLLAAELAPSKLTGQWLEEYVW